MGTPIFRRTGPVAILGVLTLAAVAACGGGSAQLVEPEKVDSAAKVSITPAGDSTDIPVSTEITWKVDKGDLTQIVLLDADGKKVKGELRPDKSSWVPAAPLEYGAKYTAKVSATDSDDLPKTVKSKFTTMDQPNNALNVSTFNGDGSTYGKSMPVIMDFPRDFEVPEDQREAVEKRLFVSSEPSQPGAWHWFSGNHLEYRPKDFWEPGTKISVRLALEGMPLGGGVYGANEVALTMNISGDDREVRVSNKNKSMSAKENGKTVKKMDISLGKKDYESYSGTMTIMEKLKETVFDTTDEPGCDGKEDGEDCYKTDIKYAQRLTWSGQFIHSAPWSVGDQGKRNVSHGCVNVSEKNAKWIFDFASVGTPVIVEGTGESLPYADGFTAYDLSWEKFLEGSYLPPPGTEGDAED